MRWELGGWLEPACGSRRCRIARCLTSSTTGEPVSAVARYGGAGVAVLKDGWALAHEVHHKLWHKLLEICILHVHFSLVLTSVEICNKASVTVSQSPSQSPRSSSNNAALLPTKLRSDLVTRSLLSSIVVSKNRVPVSTRSNAVWCGLSSYSNLVKNWPEMSGNPHPSPSNIIQPQMTNGHRMAIVDPFSDGAHSDSPSARRVTARCAELPLSRFWLPPPKSFAQRVWNRWSLPGPRPGVPLWTSPRTSCGAVR